MLINRDIANLFALLSKPIYLFAFILGLISTQRFLLSDFYAFFCIIPIIYFWLKFFYSRSIDISFLIISLLMSVDNGAEVYSETPSFIKYIIWLSFIFIFVYKSKYIKSRIIIYMLWILPIIVITVLNFDLVHLPSLYRDIFLCCLIFVATTKSTIKENYYFDNLDLKLLFFFCIGLLLAELINTNFHYSIHYLNYSSLKSFIIFPSIYLLIKRNYVSGLILSIITLYVMLFFVTRMIFICYFTILMLIALNNTRSFSFIKKLFVAIIFFPLTFFLTTLVLNYLEDSTKITSLIFMVLDNIDNSIADLLILVDPVRYYEIMILIDSNPIVWIYGNGLGTGYIDVNGYFSFLGWHAPSAFSDTELRSGFFYSFHDIWTDIGYRFGVFFSLFLPILMVYEELIDKSHDELSSIRFLIFTLAFCSFWSVSGVLLISLLYLIHRSHKKDIYSKI